jgi:hypothetical protein
MRSDAAKQLAIAREYVMQYASKVLAVCVAALGVAIMTAGAASASTLRVTNDGTDSASCGAPNKPCRTISQAIENASDGDGIEVGAGHYGNVSGDPNFGGPGDEHPQAEAGCMVCITKALSVFSLHGAAVTVIENIPSTTFISTVRILHDGVTFGQVGGGFTVTGGNAQGVVLDLGSSAEYGIVLQHEVTIAGNVALNDLIGFLFVGARFVDRPCPVLSCMSTAQVIFSDNESINNSNGATGFGVSLNTYPAPITLQSNLAQGGGDGFFVYPGEQNATGDALRAANVALLGNVAVHNGLGFFVDAPGRMTGNTAIGNAQAGFLVVPGTAPFQDNSAIGNGGPGAIVQFSTYPGDTQGNHRFEAFSENNFYGNDRNRPALTIYPGLYDVGLNPGPSAHCGVLNMGAVAAAVGPVGGMVPIINLAASGNFWGSTQGPAQTGVGDAVGGACDQNGGVTIAKPFATTPFATTSWP